MVKSRNLLLFCLFALISITVKAQTCPNDEIWYTSTNDSIVEPGISTGMYDFGVNIISNTYSGGKGIIKFDGEVKSLGNGNFSDAATLASITLPASVTKIGDACFYGCKNLKNIEIPAGVTSIGENAFQNCTNLLAINIPPLVTEIGNYTFEYDSCLSKIDLPVTITKIGKYAFRGCVSLEDIHIPDSVKTIGISAFESCKFKSLVIPNLLKKIDQYSFGNLANLTDLTIGDSVTDIEKRAFYGATSLTKLVIPDAVQRIQTNAFEKCYYLTDLTIGKSVTYITTKAFWQNAIRTITCKAEKPPYIESDTFFPLVKANVLLYVPAASVKLYKKSYYWQSFNIQAISEAEMPGDANGDNMVDVADITAIASYILGTTPAQWNAANADVNNDGAIDVADITATANIILTPTTPEYMDLGLPSATLWATCNIGAKKPEEFGDYFAWGEIATKKSYDISNYKYCKGSYSTVTKYCTKSDEGTVDNKTVLESMDDAATANCGNDWRMPTIEEFSELINSDNTTTEWTIFNNVYGRKITSKTNGNSIFLPAAGYRTWMLNSAGTSGCYWSSSLLTSCNDIGQNLYFNKTSVNNSYTDRLCGLPIRPVRNK